ncbi:MAG: hypothetical protein KIC98_01465 [Clostridioides difficile]|nr:hypothetical protein [Clostridioides difficile]
MHIYEKPVSLDLQELKDRQCLYIDNINDGFEDYSFYYKEGSEKDLREFLLNKIAENTMENTYVDFYYSKLNAEEKKKVNSILTVEEINYLESITWENNDLFFKMNSTLFEITFKLSITDMLFSTFYFSKIPCTVWSNYNRKFVVFYV